MSPSFENHLPKHHEIESELSASATNVSAWENFVDAVKYSAVQAPLQGLSQVSNNLLGSNIKVDLYDKPKASDFGTTGWHAQHLGHVAGSLPWFIGARWGAKGVGKAIGKSSALAETVGTGVVYAGFFEPVNEKADFWAQKRSNTFSTGMTFLAMGAAAGKLEGHLSRAAKIETQAGELLNASLRPSLLQRAGSFALDRAKSATIAAGAGLIASPIDPMLRSLSQNKALHGEDFLKAGYQFALAGGALGAFGPGGPKDVPRESSGPGFAPARPQPTRPILRLEPLEPRQVFSASTLTLPEVPRPPMQPAISAVEVARPVLVEHVSSTSPTAAKPIELATAAPAAKPTDIAGMTGDSKPFALKSVGHEALSPNPAPASPAPEVKGEQSGLARQDTQPQPLTPEQMQEIADALIEIEKQARELRGDAVEAPEIPQAGEGGREAPKSEEAPESHRERPEGENKADEGKLEETKGKELNEDEDPYGFEEFAINLSRPKLKKSRAEAEDNKKSTAEQRSE